MLINKIISLDSRLIKKYKVKEIKVTEKEEVGIKDLESILKKQSELLCHLEAKLPPPTKLRSNLLNFKNYTHWVATIFAILVAIKHEALDEEIIFGKLKKSRKIRGKVNKKIKDLQEEKTELLRLKQRHIFSMEQTQNLEREWHDVVHDWSLVASL